MQEQEAKPLLSIGILFRAKLLLSFGFCNVLFFSWQTPFLDNIAQRLPHRHAVRFYVQYDEKSASVCVAKAAAGLCAVLPLHYTIFSAKFQHIFSICA